MLDPALAERYRSARCVFFDCDGVILDSNRVKLGVLDEVLAEYPQASREPMRSYWKDSGGTSRYVKFDHFAREILGAPDPEREAARAVARFAERVRSAYTRCTPLPEALRVLRDTGPERSYVISGTDQRELRAVFDDKGLSALCADVLGSPATKREHVSAVLGATGATADETLFIGDGRGDFECCRALGVPFIYLAQMSEWAGARAALAGAANVAIAEDWSELLDMLSRESR